MYKFNPRAAIQRKRETIQKNNIEEIHLENYIRGIVCRELYQRGIVCRELYQIK